MTVAAKFDPRGLLAVFPSTLSFYERTGMNDEHRHTHIMYIQTEERTQAAVTLMPSLTYVHTGKYQRRTKAGMCGLNVSFSSFLCHCE